MPKVLSIFGFDFHLYGFLVGLGLVAGVWLVRRMVGRLTEQTAGRLESAKLPSAKLGVIVGVVVLAGLIGARAWHVFTELDFYAQESTDWISWLQIFDISSGGMSILGGILGGIIGIFWIARKMQLPAWLILDLASFGLPIGQAIGRLGNFVNQELYGLPTSLPWGIFIEPRSRVEGYQNFTHFHPLFLYEGLGLVGYWLWARGKLAKATGMGSAGGSWGRIGSGFYICSYLLFYTGFRFFLEFLRLDKRLIFENLTSATGWVNGSFFGLKFLGFNLLGINQTIVGVAFLLILVFAVTKKWHKQMVGLLVGLVVVGVLVTGAVVFGGRNFSTSLSDSFSAETFSATAPEIDLINHSLVDLQIGDEVLRVEVVTTPTSWTQGLSGRDSIGSDGMLFVFDSSKVRQFWMYDMLFDIDIVWINQGKVIGVSSAVPHPSPEVNPQTLPNYDSPGPADWVLELESGRARQSGIVTGMSGMIVVEKHE